MTINSDKRSVTTDALETLGNIITENEKRDAIHLAVENVEASEKLFPGQDVGLIEGLASSKASKKLGIVDPFLKNGVNRGQRFWLIVYPRQISSLRHVWEHPDFSPSELLSEASASSAAIKYLREEAERLDVGYNEMIEAVTYYAESGEYWVQGGRFEGIFISDTEKFWESFEKVTGKKVTEDRKISFFSCSC